MLFLGRMLVLLAALAALPPDAPAWLPAAPPGLPTAVTERAGQILLGTDRGLYSEEESGWGLVLTRGGVRDLAAGPERMLIATAGGLYEWDTNLPAPRPLRVGAGARVRSVAVDASGVEWVGTEVGLFSRAPGAERFERESSIPAGEVVAVRAVGSDVWAAGRGVLRVRHGEGRFEIGLRALDTGWWELLDAAPLESGTLLAVPRGLWLVRAEGAERVELGIGALSALARQGDTFWLASSRGVFRADPGGLERRELAVALDGEASDVWPGPQRLLAATRRGVASFPRTAGAERPAALGLSTPRGPAIEAVHRAVLGYLELGPAQLVRLEANARRAPLLPRVRAGLSADSDRTRARDYDQSFSSGNVHDLFDRDTSHGASLGLDFELIWDLAELGAPDRSIAISKERRELIELRDQVLDRVNRLFFERQRVLAKLASLPSGSDPERGELELRALELAAGLDAWSGGLFSRLATAHPR